MNLAALKPELSQAFYARVARDVSSASEAESCEAFYSRAAAIYPAPFPRTASVALPLDEPAALRLSLRIFDHLGIGSPNMCDRGIERCYSALAERIPSDCRVTCIFFSAVL